MRIIVISDSHNAVLNSHIESMKKEGIFDLLIHLGDNYRDADKFAQRLNIDKVYKVFGNCDFYYTNDGTVLEEVIEGKKIIMTHGHKYNVKVGLSKILEFAKEKNADLVLYGHTHKALNQMMDNILFFNPGSTTHPREGSPSFGIINITQDGIDCRHIVLND